MDGGPHQRIEPGETWTATYPVLNRAATYWYHPHPHAMNRQGVLFDPVATGYQVYQGLAAQFAENRLPTLAELDAAAPDHPVYLHMSFNGPAITNTLGKAFFEAREVSVNESGAFTTRQTAPAVQALFSDYGEQLARKMTMFAADHQRTSSTRSSTCNHGDTCRDGGAAPDFGA
jgi:hypothetical protein